jgi:phosphatidate cytidylyltransferase
LPGDGVPGDKVPANRGPGGDSPQRHKVPSRAEFEATVHDLEAQVRATNEKINQRTGRPLAMAIAVGVGLGAALLLSLLIFKELFMLFAVVLLVAVAFEFATALRVAGRDIPRIPVIITAVAVVPASFYGLAAFGLSQEAGHWLATLAGVVLVAGWRVVEQLWPSRRVAPVDLARDISAGSFVVLYAIFLPSFFVLLTAQDGGQWWTLAALICVVSVDTGAYASGLAFGKHPMAPLISPKKTWEGFAGSVAAALIAGILLAVLMLDQPWWVGIVLGVTIVLTATVGDLTESLIKRDLGIKDISTWLPGHGGLLDRLDSALPSAAAAYALFIIFT